MYLPNKTIIIYFKSEFQIKCKEGRKAGFIKSVQTFPPLFEGICVDRLL